MIRTNAVNCVLVNEKVVPVCLCRSSEGVDRQDLKMLPTNHPYVASGKQTLLHSLFFLIRIVFFRSRQEYSYFAADWRLKYSNDYS